MRSARISSLLAVGVLAAAGGAYALTRSDDDPLKQLCSFGVNTDNATGERTCVGRLVYRSREITTAELLRISRDNRDLPRWGVHLQPLTTYYFDTAVEAHAYVRAHTPSLRPAPASAASR